MCDVTASLSPASGFKAPPLMLHVNQLLVLLRQTLLSHQYSKAQQLMTAVVHAMDLCPDIVRRVSSGRRWCIAPYCILKVVYNTVACVTEGCRQCACYFSGSLPSLVVISSGDLKCHFVINTCFYIVAIV